MGFVPVDTLAFTEITEAVAKDRVSDLRRHGAIRQPEIGVDCQKQEINKSVKKLASLRAQSTNVPKARLNIFPALGQVPPRLRTRAAHQCQLSPLRSPRPPGVVTAFRPLHTFNLPPLAHDVHERLSPILLTSQLTCGESLQTHLPAACRGRRGSYTLPNPSRNHKQTAFPDSSGSGKAATPRMLRKCLASRQWPATSMRATAGGAAPTRQASDSRLLTPLPPPFARYTHKSPRQAHEPRTNRTIRSRERRGSGTGTRRQADVQAERVAPSPAAMFSCAQKTSHSISESKDIRSSRR
jgi:hypothetical protein